MSNERCNNSQKKTDDSRITVKNVQNLKSTEKIGDSITNANVICISGATQSGKSRLANILSKEEGFYKTICQ